MRCSSCQRSALDSPRSTSSSSRCAVSSCSLARASSISVAGMASSTSAIARSCSTLKKPAPGTMIISTSPSKAGPSGVTRDRSNLWVSSATYRGGLGLFLTCDFFGGVLRGLFLLGCRRIALAREPASLLHGLLDRADHVEGLLGQLVVLALEDFLEALDRVLELHVLAGRTGELLGDEVRL